MASNIWRPVDFEDAGICQLKVANKSVPFLKLILNIEPPRKKTRRCKVIEAEEEIALHAYELFSTAGWETILENVKELVREPMSGYALKVNKIKDYYQQTSSKE